MSGGKEAESLGIRPEKRGAGKKRHAGISLSGNGSDFFRVGFASIPSVTYRDEYRVPRGPGVPTFLRIRCFT